MFSPRPVLVPIPGIVTLSFTARLCAGIAVGVGVGVDDVGMGVALGTGDDVGLPVMLGVGAGVSDGFASPVGVGVAEGGMLPVVQATVYVQEPVLSA